MRKLPYFALFSLLALGVAPFAYAQTEQTDVNSQNGVQVLVVSPSPEYPQPYETFTLAPKSSLIDLSGTRLTYSVNGKVIAQTTGESPVSLKMAGPGETLHVVVTAEVDGATYQDEFTMYPQDVVLVVEPLSTVPPFYRGAALLPSKTILHISAMADFRSPGGASIPPASLSYAWSVGVRELQEQSGLGRSMLSIEGPMIYRDAKVSVIVTSRERPYAAYAETTLSPITPIVKLYRNDPLFGPLFVPSIGERFSMTTAEQGFFAVPYFFSSMPALAWDVSGKSGGTGDTITVRSSGEGNGSAVLGLEATGADVFSLANLSTVITFGETAPNSFLFGP